MRLSTRQQARMPRWVLEWELAVLASPSDAPGPDEWTESVELPALVA